MLLSRTGVTASQQIQRNIGVRARDAGCRNTEAIQQRQQAILRLAASLVVGSLPFLLGLTIVMPVLGHTTWHLYRKLVEGNPRPRPEPPRPPEPDRRRYAAQFPASLIAGEKRH